MAASILEVIITGTSTGLTSALNQGAASAKTFEKQVGGVGRSASKMGAISTTAVAGVGLAVAAFAKQSVDAAIEFDRSFTQIAALTNTTSGAIEGMKEHVLELAGTTAQSPIDLAHAMYFLASSGLDAAQQMEALDAAAKGAAVGLGEAGDLARITSNALNVFGDEGLTAVKVMDTLAAAVREGSAEPDEFANALGRVLPIAEKAGIGFDQIAASLATMSNAGLDVNEGVTALRGLLQSLVAPTAQTEDALSELGLSVDDVVRSMQQQGLIATLRMLDEAAKANTSSAGAYNILLRNIIPNVRALTGAFNLTGQEAAKVDAIFERVTNSAGTLDKAFATTAESDAFRLSQAWEHISTTGMRLATETLPSIAAALSAIVGPLQGILPVALHLGEVWLGYKTLTFIVGFVKGLAAAQTAAAASATLLATAEMNASGAMKIMSISARQATAATKASTAAANAGVAAAARWRAAATVGLVGVGLVAHAQFTSLFQGAEDLAAQFKITEEQAAALQERTNAGLLTGGQGGFFHEFADVFATSGTKAAQASEQFAALGAELAALGVPQGAINEAFEENASLLNANRASIDPWIEAIRQAALEQSGLDQATLDAAAAAEEAAKAQQVAREETDHWQHSIGELTSVFGQLNLVGIDTTGFLSDFRKNLEEADDPEAAFQAGLLEIQQQVAAWRDETAANITGVSDVLSTLADRANVSATQIIAAFDKAAENARDFAADLSVIGSTGGDTGRELAAALLAMGPSAAGFASTIAGASEDMRNRMVDSFGKVLAAGQQGAKGLQDVLVPVLNHIDKVLTGIAKFWGIDLKLNDHGAEGQLDTLRTSLSSLSAHEFQVVVAVHTRAASPWPDEVLRKHLADPIEKMGFRRIGGRWTLPLDIRPHVIGDMGMPGHGPMWEPKWYAAASRPIKVPDTGDERTRRRRRGPVPVDRRRVAEELALEADYRGWG